MMENLCPRLFIKPFIYHYWNRLLCRVLEALSKAHIALSKEHSPAKISLPSVFFQAISKGFAVCQVNTWQRKVIVTATGDGDGGFAECLDLDTRQIHNL
jgi:hypothetical protein